MDLPSVPFPSLTDMSPKKMRNGHNHNRVNSSPTLPNLWLPQFSTQHSRARPHLRPLDLAASPKLSHKSSAASLSLSNSHAHALFPSLAHSGTGTVTLGRSGTLLTPPLTPSSSFASASSSATSANSDVMPGTPPEWAIGRKGSLAKARSGYFTPSPSKHRELEIDEHDLAGPTLAELSARFGKIELGEGADDVTPRLEKTTFNLNPEHDLDFGVTDTPNEDADDSLEEVLGPDDGAPTRFVLLRGIPPHTPAATVKRAFGKDINGILVRFLESHGAVVLAYHDVRDAARGRRVLDGSALADLIPSAVVGGEQHMLTARGIARDALQRALRGSPYVAEMDGALLVRVEKSAVPAANVQQLLAGFGDLMMFESVPSDRASQIFRAEYYDTRQRESALKHLNDREIFGARFRLSLSGVTTTQLGDAVDLASPPHSPSIARHARDLEYDLKVPDTPSPVRRRDLSMDAQAEFRMRPRSVSASENMGCPDAVRRLRRGREGGSSPVESGAGSLSPHSPGRLFFDPVDSTPPPTIQTPQTPDRQRSTSMGPGGLDSPSAYAYSTYPTGQMYDTTTPPMYGYGYDYAAYQPQPQWAYPLSPSAGPGAEYYGYAQAQNYSAGSGADRDDAKSPTRRPFHPRTRRPATRSTPSPTDADSPFPVDGVIGGGEPPAKNQLDIGAIEGGMDTRTTVMIKNIPNKMTDRDLMNFIGRVCPRKIDFLYLRMDFQNGCNVGYAFVNFITVEDLLYFAKTQLGVKWNMYSSEKVLQMSYANYQGKEALVEKFKNSCIMDEREAWRPKIFFSDGPNRGLPEPFPPPTHLRRKERSASNRGALFVPGAHHYAHGGGLHHGYGNHGRGEQACGEGYGGRGSGNGRGYAPRFGQHL